MQNFFQWKRPLRYFSFRNGSILNHSRPNFAFQNIMYYELLALKSLWMICRESRIDMSINMLNPITTQIHPKCQSIATLTALHIQQFHRKDWEQNHKFLKVCLFRLCRNLESFKRKRDRQFWCQPERMGPDKWSWIWGYQTSFWRRWV